MPELTPDEYWVLEHWFGRFKNPFGAYVKLAIELTLSQKTFINVNRVLQELIEKKVLSESPDKKHVRLTDYGHQLFLHFKSEQEDWYKQEIAKVDDTEKDEILIRKGETFRGFWIIRKTCLTSQKSIAIQDSYIGPDLFKLLSEIPEAIDIKVLTSDKPYKEKGAAELAYTKLKQQRTPLEMKKSDDFHGRYIFIDRKICYEVGHSIKDLGSKEATIKRLRSCAELYHEFEKIWKTASNI